MCKHLLTLAAIAFASIACCSPAEAQLFRNARQQKQNTIYQKGRASMEHVPYTAFGRAIKARGDSRVHRVADRTGRSPEEIRGRRMMRLEVFGAALSGAADGLSGAASSIGTYSAPSLSTSRSTSLPSNFSRQMQWNNYNRNYSSLPYHRAANGY